MNAYRDVLIMEYQLLAAWMLSQGRYFSALKETARADTPKTKTIGGLLCFFLNLKRVPDLEEKADIVSYCSNQTVGLSFISPGGEQAHGGMNIAAGIVFRTNI